MRCFWFAAFVLIALALPVQAQRPEPATKDDHPREADEKPAQPAPPVEADSAVITIKGLCDQGKAGTPDCQTVVTRAQFEKLAEALQPGVPAQSQTQLAEAYGRFVPLSKEAEKRGLDKSEKLETVMQFDRIRVLAMQLASQIQEEAGKVPDSEIEKYYKDNPEAFEEADLLRLFVPRTKIVEPVKGAKEPDEVSQKASEAAMKREADALHAKAVAGGDFDALQKAAFVAGGVKAAPPTARLEHVRRTGLPPEHQAIFDLKPGEVSPVISDEGGFFIYKLVSKQQVPLAEVKDEIHRTLQRQRFADMQQQLQSATTVELNQNYFGGEGARPNPAMKPPAPKSETPKSAPPPK